MLRKEYCCEGGRVSSSANGKSQSLYCGNDRWPCQNVHEEDRRGSSTITLVAKSSSDSKSCEGESRGAVSVRLAGLAKRSEMRK